MKYLLLFLALSLPAHAGILDPDNWAECILSKMPGVANDPTAYAIFQECRKYGAVDEVPQGSGIGFMSYHSRNECMADKAAKTQSRQASVFIGLACRDLYESCDSAALRNPYMNSSDPLFYVQQQCKKQGLLHLKNPSIFDDLIPKPD